MLHQPSKQCNHLSHRQPFQRVTNAWLTWALVYLCGHVMQFELSTIAKRVTAGNVMEIIMGRALTTQRYDMYDYLQRMHTQWFWLLKTCHTITDKGPRWMTYEHPKVKPVNAPREHKRPYVD